MGLQNHERQSGLVRYAREAGWIIDSRLLSFHAMGQDQEYVGSSRYDGVLALMSRVSPWLPALVKSLGVPVVDMWADYLDERYPRVLLDHAAIGRAGAQYLLDRGFRQLLFYTHGIEGKGSKARAAAFREAVLARGAQYHELIWDHMAPPPGGQSRMSWLTGWLTQAPRPLAVMGANDHIACEVLEAAELAGLQVPRQVAVLGVDDDALVTELAPVPLSSIDSARQRAGYEAAALLDRLMNGEPPPSQPLLIAPGRVITRRSTDVRAVRDPDVAAAMQFIQDHFRESITVDDVAAYGALSAATSRTAS